MILKPGYMKKVTMKPRQFITRNLRSSRNMVTQYLRECRSWKAGQQHLIILVLLWFVMMESSHSTKQGMKNWFTFLQRRCRKLKKLVHMKQQWMHEQL